MITVKEMIAMLSKLPPHLPMVVNSELGEYWHATGALVVKTQKHWRYPRPENEVPPEKGVEIR